MTQKKRVQQQLVKLWQYFFEGLANAATNEFSERFSIQDNKLLLKNYVELEVADSAI